ncbi:MAG: ATP-dependent helicase/nuclease subunit [Thermoanaerobacteraceae bacterium]|nr:ATP-dependent helicase/nuclease subunit [Thermoanaerobacteraceae bacterium]
MDIDKTMREYDVNEEQAKALDVEKNIALHAGAGSGKTRVLSRRFLRLMLEKDADVDSIVAITFTNRAAMEMKERVRILVNEKILKEKDPQQLCRLNAIKEELQAANISTFHSFCDKILRENCSMAGLDPMYRIIEDVDRETLLTKIIRQQINEMMADRSFDEDFKKLFGLYGTDYYYKEGLLKDIKYLYNKMREKAMSADEVKDSTLVNISRFYKENGEECFEEVDLLEKIEMFIVTILKKVDEVFSKYKMENNLVDFNDLEIFTIRLLEDESLREHYRRRFKYFLVDEFQDTNWVQRKILYALVMEKDGAIPPGSLFIVGDVKQSIYGFRGADYEVFSSVTQKISENGEKLELSTCYRSHPDIVKTVNSIFKNLFTNFVPLKNVEGYQGHARVEYALVEKQKKDNDLWKKGKGILKKGSQEEVKDFLDEFLADGNDVPEDNNLKQEAKDLALNIKALRNSGFEYKDMAILFRSRTNLSGFEETLRKNGIPYCVIGGIGFFEKQEIVDMMNILKCVYDPDDKAALLGVLRSPYIGVSDDLLLEIFDKLDDGDKLKKVLEKKASGGLTIQERGELPGCFAKTESEIVINALELLNEMRQRACYYNISDFVLLIIEKFHVKEILLSLRNGAAMYRNIEKFINIARDFDSKDIYSPKDFLDYVQNLQEVSNKEAEAVLDTEDSNAVKIMTIHAAKGLEFEAVFIPEIGRALLYNAKRHKPYFQFSGEYGIIARFDDKITGKKGTENKLYDFVREEALERELEESKRMLYVAATRAKRYLCFVGEDVELKDDDKLDSFVKMLKSALKGEETIVTMSAGFSESEKDNDGIDGIIGNADNYVETCIYADTRADESKDVILNVDSSAYKYVRPDDDIVKDILEKIEFSPHYTIKSSFSISRYFTFRDCQRKFFYIYKAGLDSSRFEKDVEMLAGADGQAFISASSVFQGAVKGKLIHSILERIKENGGDMNEIIKQYAGLNAADEIEEIKRLIKNYKIAEAKYEKINPYSRIKTEREIPFAVPLYEGKAKTVYGVIDRLDIFDNNGSLEGCLIDYKTNRINSPQDMERLIAHYRPQFILYHLGFERLYPRIHDGIKLKGMYIFFLDVGEVAQVSFNAKEREEFLSKLDSTMEFIESHDSMEDYRCRPSCNHKCEFALLCE